MMNQDLQQAIAELQEFIVVLPDILWKISSKVPG